MTETGMLFAERKDERIFEVISLKYLDQIIQVDPWRGL